MGNSRDNKDRYGSRHRSDDVHDVGGPQPGDVGDSGGTFHDRARKNTDVVSGGKVRSAESHARTSEEVESTDSHSSNSTSTSGNTISQDEAVNSVVTVEIDRYGGTKETLATWENHQIHIDGGTPGETVRVELERGEGFLVGSYISVTNGSRV